MKPTEHEMTVAVDAAARLVWAETASAGGPPGTAWAATFDQANPVRTNRLRERVLGFVVAALEALPDRAEAERVRIGSYLTDDMWCHHDGCALVESPRDKACSCGLEDLLTELDEVKAG